MTPIVVVMMWPALAPVVAGLVLVAAADTSELPVVETAAI